jgi:hypothetical protein
VDVEGAEMNVFRGAEALLDSGRILFIRTEFQAFPYYADHPVFGEQHSYLNGKGYRLIDITTEQPRYRRGSLDLPNDCDRPLLGSGDALFVRDPDRNPLSALELHRLALLCFAFDFNSFALSLVADARLLSTIEFESVVQAVRARSLKTWRRRTLDIWNGIPYLVYGLARRALRR